MSTQIRNRSAIVFRYELSVYFLRRLSLRRREVSTGANAGDSRISQNAIAGISDVLDFVVAADAGLHTPISVMLTSTPAFSLSTAQVVHAICFSRASSSIMPNFSIRCQSASIMPGTSRLRLSPGV